MNSLRVSLALVVLLFVVKSGLSQFSELDSPLYKLEKVRSIQFKDSAIGYFGVDSSFIYHGTFIQYFRNTVHVEGYYEHGIPNGFWKKYHANGRLSTKGMYAGGKPHGVWKFYYETDTLASILYYNLGKVVGVATEFDFNGSKRAEWRSNNEGELERVIYYHTNGNVAGDDSIRLIGSDTLIHRTLYYSNGKVYYKGDIKNGKNDGDYMTFYESGNPWEYITCEDGLAVKVHYMFNRKGEHLNYEDTKKGIVMRLYHANNDIYEEVTKGGGDTLHYVFYDYGNAPSIRGSAVNRKPVGTWVFTDHGKWVKDIKFIDGYDHYTITCDSPGISKYVREYLHGKPHGKVVITDIYKTRIKELNFDRGYLSGPFYELQNSGISLIGNCVNNNASGLFVSSRSLRNAKPDTIVINGDFTVDTSSAYFTVGKPDIVGDLVTNYKYEYVYKDWYRFNSALNSFDAEHERTFNIISSTIKKPQLAKELNVSGEVVAEYWIRIILWGEKFFKQIVFQV